MKEPKLRGDGLPEVSDARLDWSQVGVNWDRDGLFEGITWRRIAAFCIDFSIISVILAAVGVIVFLSLGFFAALLALTPFVPVAYNTLTIAGRRSATIGMQFMGIEVRSLSGARPTLIQAFAMSALFYLSISVATPLILLVALFNDRRRCAHDILSGTILVLADADL